MSECVGRAGWGEGEGTAKWPPLSKELIYCTLTRHSAGKPDRFTIIPVDDRYRSEGGGGVVSYGTARRASGGALTLALACNCKVTDKPCQMTAELWVKDFSYSARFQ